MKTFLKALAITVALVACKKSVEPAKPLPKSYQNALIRVQAVDNDSATTNSQVVFIKIEN